MVGCSSWSSEPGSIRATASSLVISFSLASSTAIRSAAFAVRLPYRRLQHPELALLDGELDVLHVAVVLLERAVDARQLLERRRHRVFHRRLVGAGLLARDLGDLLRRADAGDDVLALGVDQEFAVEPLLAGRRIAGEGDAGRRGVAHVAEHHGLHVDRGAPAFRNVVQAAIGDGARVHPRAEHRADRAPELLARVLRERLAVLLARRAPCSAPTTSTQSSAVSSVSSV